MRLTLTVDSGDRRVDVLVDADDDATIGALAHQLAACSPEVAPRLYVGPQELAPQTRLADSGLLDGCVVGLGRPLLPAEPDPQTVGWQLHAVAGPDAGTVLALPVGDHELGRTVSVAFGDTAMSRRHALLSVRPDGAIVTDQRSSNGTTVDGTRCAPGLPVPVQPGALLGMGDTLLTLRPARGADAATEPAEPGRRSFLRPPRMLPLERPVTIRLPDPPDQPARRKLPVATVAAPLVLGVVMALLASPMYLLLTLAGPVVMVANLVGERRAGAKEHAKALAGYTATLAAAQARIAAAVTDEQSRRRAELPDAAETLLTCRLPGRRLWERRRTDADALAVRVGVTDLPASVQVESGRQRAAEPGLLRAVPVAVALREVGVLGVAGPRPRVLGSLRWIVSQLAAYHAPRDLTLTLLTDVSSDHWEWWRWLPHARPRDPDRCVALVGNDAETVAARVTELLAEVRRRQDVVRTSGRVEPAYFTTHVLVVDGARALRATPGLAALLDDGPSVGVYAVCGDEDERFLPESCRATLLVDADAASLGELRRDGAATVTSIRWEGVSSPWAATVARALAPLKDVRGDEGDVDLPGSVRLLDVLMLEPPAVETVRARWLHGGRTTSATVGVGLEGPFTVDLQRDGPHGLVAGTTGSGKSELLQTIIASLAVGNRPDAINFVLVDYKGGSAFKDCARLPHTVGMVTDLDHHLVERALVSLGAELTWREHFLARAGVKDIDDYLDLQATDASRPPLPRLLIVIDEFASMARELPEFVNGLVDLARRGRSLGIHLLLATQRPSGVVSPEIRANTNLRISLRVTDAADSNDVLEAPDAARIARSTPGRGFARLGAGALVPFQAARVGGRRPGVAAAHVPPPYIAPLTWRAMGYAAPHPPPMTVRDDVEVTDLSVLVDAVRRAAEADGHEPQRRPWLDPLPDHLLLDDVARDSGFAFGVTDLPHEQARRTATFDPVRDGHLLVVGSARSGRSQLLRTLAASIAATASVADVHVFGLDCGNGALVALQDLPHCGAVVTRNQPERAGRLLARFEQEMHRRQQLLAETGHADIAEQRAAGAGPLPHLVLMLDRWEGFTSALGDLDGGRLTDIVLAVLREGASLGVHAVITGDRSLGSGRIAALTDNKLALKLADKADYSLVGLNPRQLPDTVPPGRGVIGGSGLETQVALLAADDSGQAQAAALAAVACAAADRAAALPRTVRPFRVDVLPARIDLAAARALLPAGSGSPYAIVGVGGDELHAVGTDFTDGSCFVVAGPGRSGRSTALTVMARSLTQSGASVVIAAPRPSPLWQMAGERGVLAIVRDACTPAETYLAAVAAGGETPLVVIVDDGQVLRDCPAADFFRAVVKESLRPQLHLVLGGNAEEICAGLSGWQVEAKKARQGLLLSPQGLSDGDLVGVRLPRSLVGLPVQPGRGLLHRGDSRLLSVTVPTL